MADQSSSWPPPEGITTQKIPLENNVFPVSGSTTINAPASFIFNIILNTSTYPEWCTFIPKVDIDSHPSSSATNDHLPSTTAPDPILKPSTKFTFHANMSLDPAKPKLYPTKLIVTDISTPEHPSAYVPAATLASEPTYTADLGTVYRVSWGNYKSSVFAVGPEVERFHEIIVRGEERCEVRTWECQGGPVAHLVKWIYKATLEKKFVHWCEELKGYGEAQWKKEGHGH